ICGSASPPLTSLTSRAPASSAGCATSARIVSTLTGTPAAASARMTGPTRRSSSSADTRCAPGRVDSPPTSTMSAPCAASSRPRAIAASGPNQDPPSENESGVTLTTPITRQRAALGSPGGLGARCAWPGPPGRPGPPWPPARAPASLAMSVTLCGQRIIPQRHARGTPRLPGLWAAGRAGGNRAGQPGGGAAAELRRGGGGGARRARGRPGLENAAQAAPHTGQPQLAGQPAQFQLGPDQERLGLQRGHADPDRVPGAGEDAEARLPDRAELGVELVQRLDLEPAGDEDEEAAPDPQHRARADPLASFQGGPEDREVERDALDAQRVGGLDGLHDQEVVHARLGAAVPAHQVQRQPVGSPGDEVQQAPEHPVLGRRGDDALPVLGPAYPA